MIEKMLEKYQPKTAIEYENGLKEIIQQIALLGLSRAKFFDKAAFYGGTALRILHGLQRFSEDLDFTLLNKNPDFKLNSYFSAVQTELKAFGFEVQVEEINKKSILNIESAFIKADTKMHLLTIKSAEKIVKHIQHGQKLRIKFEINVDPPLTFETDIHSVLEPTLHTVKCLQLPDLFAGKIHALLFRKWKHRIKGRDYYDFLWYLGRRIPIRLDYLKENMVMGEMLKKEEPLTVPYIVKLLKNKFSITDFETAKIDVLPYIKDPRELELWLIELFTEMADRVTVIPS